MEKFYERLAVVIEEEAVKPEDVLSKFEQWDSLTALSVIAMIEEHYSVNVSGEDLAEARTAGALEAFVVGKRLK